MDASTNTGTKSKPKQVWPHAYWSLLALAMLWTFSWYFEDVKSVDGVKVVSTDWRGVVFAMLLASACVWSFVRCPRRILFVNFVTLVCLIITSCLAVYSLATFLGFGGKP